jgi:hypothetical protein
VWPAKAIGKDRIADLLARDDNDGSLVIIENQLELADDAHLGQILAYLAGSGANTMIWIAENFEPRHRAIIRWLNEATSDEYRFFAVRVRIALAEDGGVTPAFDVMQGPAAWAPPTDHLGPIQDLGFPAGFWAFHLDRYPDEVLLSRSVGLRCRWRATKVKGIVIGQLVRENEIDVFLRGRDGMPLHEAEAALAPFARAIVEQLGETTTSYGLGFLMGKTLKTYVNYTCNWGEASDWMRAQADLFDVALSGTGSRKGRRRNRRESGSV